MQSRYDHITPGRRQALMIALTGTWEQASNARLVMSPGLACNCSGSAAKDSLIGRCSGGDFQDILQDLSREPLENSSGLVLISQHQP